MTAIHHAHALAEETARRLNDLKSELEFTLDHVEKLRVLLDEDREIKHPPGVSESQENFFEVGYHTPEAGPDEITVAYVPAGYVMSVDATSPYEGRSGPAYVLLPGAPDLGPLEYIRPAPGHTPTLDHLAHIQGAHIVATLRPLSELGEDGTDFYPDYAGQEIELYSDGSGDHTPWTDQPLPHEAFYVASDDIASYVVKELP